MRPSAALVGLYATSALASRPVCGTSISSEVSTLSSCKTASAFCKSYIGGPGTATETLKATITTTASASKTVTATTTSTTTFYTGTTSTSVSHYSGIYCAASTFGAAAQKDAARQPAPSGALSKKKPAPSCGFDTSVKAQSISAACDCYLAKTTTDYKTKTVTSKTVSTVTTTRVVAAVAEETVYQYQTCSTPYFTLQADAQDQLAYPSDGSSGYLFQSSNPSVFYIYQGGGWFDTQEATSMVQVNYPFTGGQTAEAVNVIYNDQNGTLENCFLDSGAGTMNCTNNAGGNNPFSCLFQDSAGNLNRGLVFSSSAPNQGCFPITLSYVLQ